MAVLKNYEGQKPLLLVKEEKAPSLLFESYLNLRITEVGVES